MMGVSLGDWKFVESKYSHENTLSLGNYRGDPFVTGCDDTIDFMCSTKTEIMSRGVTDGEYWSQWQDAPDYPFSVPDYGLDSYYMYMNGRYIFSSNIFYIF